MKIALAQLNYTIGDLDHNTSVILSCIETAKDGGADLIVFSELAICGYPPLDLLTHSHFIDQCEAKLNEIAAQCNGIAAIVGAPTKNKATRGKALFNSACFLADGKVKFVQHKSLLPDYDVFDEYRYFEPNTKPETFTYKGYKIALTICEDLWEVGEPTLYHKQPMEIMGSKAPDLIINIAASPFNTVQAEMRKAVLEKNAKRYGAPIYYVNHVGAQTDIIFDGGSLYCDEKGVIIQELPYFKEEIRIIDSETRNVLPALTKIERIERALMLGIRDFFHKQRFTHAVIGLSGGIDSAVTAALAVKVLGAEHVVGVLMPSPYSSQHSVDDAMKLAQNLGIESHTLPIGEMFSSFNDNLGAVFHGAPADVTEENLQARIRGTLLMALSNKFGYIVLNTTNKSEAAVGYGTLYGDLCGGLAVLADVYKTEVYELAHHLNKNGELIPNNTIVKAPSAELRPDQKDSDSLPEYPELDAILRLYIEQTRSAEQIIASGHKKETVTRVLTLVNRNEYKRFQTAPALRVSKKAFGSGRKMPLVGKIF